MLVVKIQLNFHPVEENYQLQILKFSISDFNYDLELIELNRLINDNCIEATFLEVMSLEREQRNGETLDF